MLHDNSLLNTAMILIFKMDLKNVNSFWGALSAFPNNSEEACDLRIKV